MLALPQASDLSRTAVVEKSFRPIFCNVYIPARTQPQADRSSPKTQPWDTVVENGWILPPTGRPTILLYSSGINTHSRAIQLENTKKSELVIKMVTFIATLLLYTQQFSLSTLYIKIGNRRHFEDIANIDDVLKHD